MLKIPVAECDITKEFLNSVLTDFEEITSVDLKTPRTHGAASSTRKVFLQYSAKENKKCPPTLIAKYGLPSAENIVDGKNVQFRMMHDGEFYKREVLINKYLNEMNLGFVPEIYYASYNKEQDFIILMEDCSTEEIVKTEKYNEFSQSLEEDQIFLVLKEISKLHAKYYHLNREDRLTKMKGILCGNDDTFMHDKFLKWVPEYVQIIYYFLQQQGVIQCSNKDDLYKFEVDKLSSYAKLLNENWNFNFDFIINNDIWKSPKLAQYEIPMKMKCIEDKKNIEELANKSIHVLAREAALTLVHSDFRSDNFVFSSGHVKVVDWAMAAVGCGMIDVSRMMMNSVTIETRMVIEERVIEEYLNILHANGCSFISTDNARKWYNAATWYELGIRMTYLKIVKLSTDKETILGTSKSLYLERLLTGFANVIDKIYKEFYL